MQIEGKNDLFVNKHNQFAKLLILPYVIGKVQKRRTSHLIPLQYSYLENSVNSVKKQKDMTLENEAPVQKMSNMFLGKSQGQLIIAPERMKQLGQNRNNAQLWMCLVVKVNYYTVKHNIA